jgi:glycerol-3-phosphate O-acyltransferase
MGLLTKIMKWSGAFFVKRGVGKKDLNLIREVKSIISNNEPIEVFFEGTRSRERR